LPWILLNIEIILSDIEMKMKMMEIIKMMSMTIIDGSIKKNSFQFAKRQKNFIKSFCSTIFYRKGDSSEF
jgi:tRNA A37 N6-isopentenylltransferase MiaA